MEALVYPSLPKPRQWLQQLLVSGDISGWQYTLPAGLAMLVVLVPDHSGSDPADLELVGQVPFFPGFWRFVLLWPWLFPCP